MPAPYSIDLRKKVIAAVENGVGVVAAAMQFDIGRSTVQRWLILQNKTNSIAPKSGYQKGHSRKIIDLQKFKVFVIRNKKLTSGQMALKWQKETGEQVSENTVQKKLKEIGFTFKKKHFIFEKQIKKVVNNLWTSSSK